MARVLIVLPSGSYRTADFVGAARTLRAEAVIATDAVHVQVSDLAQRVVRIDPHRTDWSVARIVEFARTSPLDAVIAADDAGVLIAAQAAQQLNLAHNPPEAVSATRNKVAMRQAFANAGLPQPAYRIIRADTDAVQECIDLGFPCVLKPVSLSASRGVIRVDDAGSVPETVARVRAIAAGAGCPPDDPVLAESFVAGSEVSLEGMLVDGRLEVLALFDKPDPMNGPYFEETILVTPSRLDPAIQAQVVSVCGAAATALGLVQGPIHAEARVGDHAVSLLEVAARSIGGLCGRSLSFGLLGTSLEATLLGSALGYSSTSARAASPSTGVMMLPIEHAGTLREVAGMGLAKAVPGIVDIEITVPIGTVLRPAPEADRYLGFVFAIGETPALVERSLRQAHAVLNISIR